MVNYRTLICLHNASIYEKQGISLFIYLYVCLFFLMALLSSCLGLKLVCYLFLPGIKVPIFLDLILIQKDWVAWWGLEEGIQGSVRVIYVASADRTLTPRGKRRGISSSGAA